MLPVHYPAALQVESCSLLDAVALMWIGRLGVLGDSVLLTWQTVWDSPSPFCDVQGYSPFPSQQFKLNIQCALERLLPLAWLQAQSQKTSNASSTTQI